MSASLQGGVRGRGGDGVGLWEGREVESEQHPSPERWTRKEVVGHLIDSASNNHQRFVRGQVASGKIAPATSKSSGPHPELPIGSVV